jgi:hypothetical protein
LGGGVQFAWSDIYIYKLYCTFIFRIYVERSHMLQKLKQFDALEPYNRTAGAVKEMSLLACPRARQIYRI